MMFGDLINAFGLKIRYVGDLKLWDQSGVTIENSSRMSSNRCSIAARCASVPLTLTLMSSRLAGYAGTCAR